MTRITKHQYTGYLAPWLDDINKLWDAGHTTAQIAAVMRRNVAQHPEKLPYYYQRYQIVPLPTSSMVHYALERTRGTLIDRSSAAFDYPTAERWRNLLPVEIAHKQARWERRRAIHNMQELGFTLDKIGQRIGRSRERVRQLTLKPLAPYSPLELFLQDEKVHLRELAKSPTLLSIVTMNGMHSRFRDK